MLLGHLFFRSSLFTLILGFGLMQSPEALARPQATQRKALVKVTAEAEPGKTGEIGVNITPDKKILSFYFKNPGGRIAEYSGPQLANYKTLVHKSGYDLIKVKSPSNSGDHMYLTIRFTKSVVDGEKGYRFFVIRYNYHRHDFEILDEDHRPFTRAHVVTHESVVGVDTGIEEIRTHQ